jgi:VWFA-related protein
MRLGHGFLLALVALATAAAQEPQRQPTFRTGVNLVRVDAYPSKDGKIIEGLTADDFEVLEDGAPQKIESFQFVRYEQNNPVEERRDPNSQREAFDLAADPSRRVFVIYLDHQHVDFTDSHRIRAPLITFLNRVLGPRDLFGVLTTKQRPEDLMLGAQSLFIEEQLTKHWDWGRGARVLEDEEDEMLAACYAADPANGPLLGELISRRRLSAVFDDLEGLSYLLANLREERKNIVLVSKGWPMMPASRAYASRAKPRMPTVGVNETGKLTIGSRRPGEVSLKWCEEQMQRLMLIDFERRFRDFLDLARRSNVTFYVINPGGLEASASPMGITMIQRRTDVLLTLADNTDGLAIVNTNDLTGGARKIADDLSAAYILGYYPTNTKADGGIRRITVRLKGQRGDVRARREYKALTADEVASMRAVVAARSAAPAEAAPAEGALAELKRLRPGAVIHTRGTVLGDRLVLTTELNAPEVEAGRWKTGGELQVVVSTAAGDVITTGRGKLEPGARAAVVRIPLERAPGPFHATVRLRGETNVEDSAVVSRSTGVFGAPLVFRLATPTQPRPAGSVYFRRTERLQVRWPVTGAVTDPQGRVLGRDGVPLELAVTVSTKTEDAVAFVVADLNLAALTAGEYILEVSGRAGDKSETAHLAFRVFR